MNTETTTENEKKLKVHIQNFLLSLCENSRTLSGGDKYPNKWFIYDANNDLIFKFNKKTGKLWYSHFLIYQILITVFGCDYDEINENVSEVFEANFGLGKPKYAISYIKEDEKGYRVWASNALESPFLIENKNTNENWQQSTNEPSRISSIDFTNGIFTPAPIFIKMFVDMTKDEKLLEIAEKLGKVKSLSFLLYQATFPLRYYYSEIDRVILEEADGNEEYKNAIIRVLLSKGLLYDEKRC